MAGIKLKTPPLYPDPVIGGAGIDVTKAHGNWTISLDWSKFGIVSPYVPRVGDYVLIFSPDALGFVMVPVASVGSSISTGVGAATGAGAASAVGVPLTVSVGAAAGTGAANAVGTAITSRIGAAAGTGAASAVGGVLACDLGFSNVVLLMGFEDINGSISAPGWTDESSHAHGTATLGGGAAISTAQAKFGSGSGAFNSLSLASFANSADWQLGNSPFTIEGFANIGSGNPGSLVGLWGAGGNPNQLSWLVFYSGSDGKLHWNTSTTGSNNLTDITGATTIPLNTWIAWCVDFDGAKYRLYLNGVMDGSFTTVRNLFASTSALTLGQSFSTNYLGGFLDEVRITRGVARYASDLGYTVPTAAFPRTQCGCSEAAAFLARTSGLDALHTSAITNLICGLATDGLWSKFDVVKVYATQNGTPALLNLVSTSYTSVIHGSPTFTADRGFTGVSGSTTVYVDTTFAPTGAASPQYTQNSAHISAWAVTDQGAGNWAIAGAASGSSETVILPKWSDGNTYFRINGNSTPGVSGIPAVGHFVGSRTNSTTIAGYRNGSSILSNSADASATPPSTSIFSLSEDIAGTGTWGYPGQIAMLTLGSGLTATDVLKLYNRSRAYMTAVGVP